MKKKCIIIFFKISVKLNEIKNWMLEIGVKKK